MEEQNEESAVRETEDKIVISNTILTMIRATRVGVGPSWSVVMVSLTIGSGTRHFEMRD
jgi:hypothetical protein